jgi:glyoxylase-like metal-dependent hydrolase (beta-lactamase superfamily II)
MQVIDLNFLDLSSAVAAFLLQSSEGPILIETGPHATLPRLVESIEQAGYRAADVKHVLLTHIHLDHAGAAWWFARQGATVYVHPKGLPHLMDPSKLMASARMIYQDQMDRLWGEMHPIDPDRLRQVNDDEELLLGDVRVIARHTPGHAVHHIAWQWEDCLFTGDVGGVKIGNGPVMPPCPPPDIHLPDWMQSIERMRALAAGKLYLTHFGLVTDKEGHLDELTLRLNAWAEWMKPHYLAGTAAAIITPAFQAYVREDLVSHGLSEETIDRYEAANPAWMSVAGLLRYWKKALTV